MPGAIPLMNKSGNSITNAFRTIILEGRKPQNLGVNSCNDLYKETFKSLHKEYDLQFFLHIVV